MLIRADATPNAGTGHVMRSIALAQAWQDAGGSATLGMARGAEAFAGRLEREGIAAEPVEGEPGSAADARETCRLGRRMGARAIVVDGYWAGGTYQRAVRAEGFRLALIDDTGALAPYAADVIVNQNLHASDALYADRTAGTVLLLGPRYALLRREFRKATPPERNAPERARRILVTLGGSDPDGATARVLRAISPLARETELTVLVGAVNPRGEEVVLAARPWKDRARVLRDVEDVPALLAGVDLAISAGGSTCWELCFFGVPFVTLVLAPNQAVIAESLAAAGASENAGAAEGLDFEALAGRVQALAGRADRRRRMAAAGRALVDGRGAERVAARLLEAEAA